MIWKVSINGRTYCSSDQKEIAAFMVFWNLSYAWRPYKVTDRPDLVEGFPMPYVPGVELAPTWL